jgi:hypothetical protein
VRGALWALLNWGAANAKANQRDQSHHKNAETHPTSETTRNQIEENPRTIKIIEGWGGTNKMAIYEVAYSTKTASNDELSFSDIVLVEAETHEELYTNVVDLLLRTLGPSGNYYVDSIGDNPYQARPTALIKNRRAKDYKEIVSAINALISKRNQRP